MIKSYIFMPALSASDPSATELIKTGPLPVTMIPKGPPPAGMFMDLKRNDYKFGVTNNSPPQYSPSNRNRNTCIVDFKGFSMWL